MNLNEVVKNFEAAGKDSSEFTRIRQMYESCVIQTFNFVDRAGFSDVVVGLSGGIDSTLVAKIAVDAFGAEHVHGLLMPGPFSSGHSVSDSRALAKSLGIVTNCLHIQKPVEAFQAELENELGHDISDMTRQNIQARSRMIFLMAVSNENGWLVLNTGNKSEACTGYSTMHGDMVGAFAPIGGVYKTDVFRMCAMLNIKEAREVIPRNVLLKPPSAELTAGQTDEDSLGVEYDVLDSILRMMVDEDLPDSKILQARYSQAQIDIVRKKYQTSAFKRPFEPPCAKVSQQ